MNNERYYTIDGSFYLLAYNTVNDIRVRYISEYDIEEDNIHATIDLCRSDILNKVGIIKDIYALDIKYKNINMSTMYNDNMYNELYNLRQSLTNNIILRIYYETCLNNRLEELSDIRQLLSNSVVLDNYCNLPIGIDNIIELYDKIVDVRIIEDRCMYYNGIPNIVTNRLNIIYSRIAEKLEPIICNIADEYIDLFTSYNLDEMKDAYYSTLAFCLNRTLDYLKIGYHNGLSSHLLEIIKKFDPHYHQWLDLQ